MRAATPTSAVSETGGLASLDGSEIVVTSLVELPPPTSQDIGPSPWQPFIDHALSQAEALPGAARPQSALIVPDALLISSNRRQCSKRSPAVIIDLDSAGMAFAPARVGAPIAGLAAGLARLREAGVVVLWLSDLPASRVGEVASVLRSSGLDPEGKDQFLLIRWPDDRKQALREQANEDVCVVALAGDSRNDFDELFDYLRDPDLAVGLDSMIGQGWFIVPPALAPLSE